MLPSAEAGDSAGSDSEPSSPEREIKNADELIAQGKRDVVCNDIASAVECFQEACRLLADEYGDFGDEVGEAYLHYGKALLELARSDNNVIGGALPGAEQQQNDDDDSENEDNSADEAKEVKADASEEKKGTSIAGGDSADLDIPMQQATQSGDVDATKTTDIVKGDIDCAALPGGDTLGNEASKSSAISSDKITSGACSQDEEAASTTAVGTDAVVDKAADDATAGKATNTAVDQVADGTAASSGTKPEQEAEADADDNEGDQLPPLQLAWEVLEMAKVIFSRHSDKERKLKAADAHQMLGEVSLESEMYDQAIEDFNNCLRMQSEVLGADDRDLAATHYQLGMAYNMVQRLEDAIGEFNAAKKILQERAAVLEQQLQCPSKPVQESESGDANDKKEHGADDASDKQRRELDEITSLLPEIAAKIEDCEEEARVGKKVEVMLRASVASTMAGFEASSSGFEPCSSSSGSKPVVVNNISNLIRKKRAEPEDNNADAKKPKVEETCPGGGCTEAVNVGASVSTVGDHEQDCAH